MRQVGASAPARRFRRHRWAIGVTLVVTLIACAGPASAQTPPSSAVDQYVEDQPTSEGSVPTTGSGGGGSPPQTTGLDHKTSAAITRQGGEDTPVLKALATDARYGAPQDKLKTTRKAREVGLSRGGSDASPGEAVSAAVSAVQGGEAGRLIGLLVVLFVISVMTLGAAALRQKRRAV
jgi:hypothetical protein